MSQPNMLFAFAGSIDDILFISPARSTDYLLLISDKEGEKRYRIVPLDMLEKSMSESQAKFNSGAEKLLDKITKDIQM